MPIPAPPRSQYFLAGIPPVPRRIAGPRVQFFVARTPSAARLPLAVPRFQFFVARPLVLPHLPLVNPRTQFFVHHDPVGAVLALVNPFAQYFCAGPVPAGIYPDSFQGAVVALWNATPALVAGLGPLTEKVQSGGTSIPFAIMRTRISTQVLLNNTSRVDDWNLTFEATAETVEDAEDWGELIEDTFAPKLPTPPVTLRFDGGWSLPAFLKSNDQTPVIGRGPNNLKLTKFCVSFMCRVRSNSL